MDIGISQITSVIASSTTSYFSLYSPIFLLVGGLVLAYIVIGYLIDIVNFNRGISNGRVDYPQTSFSDFREAKNKRIRESYLGADDDDDDDDDDWI